jgi:hypothetical protein
MMNGNRGRQMLELKHEAARLLGVSARRQFWWRIYPSHGKHTLHL